MGMAPPTKEERSVRSFRGCRGCRRAKRRCSEEKPVCAGWAKAGRKCEVSTTTTSTELIIKYDTDSLFRFSLYAPGHSENEDDLNSPRPPMHRKGSSTVISKTISLMTNRGKTPEQHFQNCTTNGTRTIWDNVTRVTWKRVVRFCFFWRPRGKLQWGRIRHDSSLSGRWRKSRRRHWHSLLQLFRWKNARCYGIFCVLSPPYSKFSWEISSSRSITTLDSIYVGLGLGFDETTAPRQILCPSTKSTNASSKLSCWRSYRRNYRISCICVCVDGCGMW